MLEFQTLRTINDYIHIYQKFPLPAVIFTRGFDVCWSNEAAKALYPSLCSEGGIGDLLAEYDLDHLARLMKQEGSVTISDAIPLSETSVTLLPILSAESEPVGFVLLLFKAALQPDASASYLSSKTAEALSSGIRESVQDIFDAMDTASLKADLIGAGWLKSSFNRISGQSYHILRIAGNVSEYTRFQSGAAMLDMTAVDLADLLAEMAEPVTALCASMSIPITLRIPSKTCLISGDRNRLELAVMNLIHNSLYYTRTGNSITLSLAKKDGAAILRVEDRGIGIPKAILPEVWRPYYTYDNDRRGAGVGLGLALVKAIVTAHGGQYRITSKEGSGTKVTLTFPGIALANSISLGREPGRSRMDDRFSTVYTGLVDAGRSPYRQQ